MPDGVDPMSNKMIPPECKQADHRFRFRVETDDLICVACELVLKPRNNTLYAQQPVNRQVTTATSIALEYTTRYVPESGTPLDLVHKGGYIKS